MTGDPGHPRDTVVEAARGVTAHARATPDRPAVVCGEHTLTYAELDARSNRLAQVMRDLGVQTGDAVAAVLPNGSEILEVATAATMLGARYLPVNWHLKADELAYILRDSDARLVVTHVPLSDRVSSAVGDLAVCRVLTVGGDYEPAIAGVPGPDPSLEAATGPAFIFYTSGTTARPKGVVHQAAGASRQRARQMQESQVELWGWTAGDTYVVTGPLYHAAHGGWASTALYVGAQVVLMASWDAREWLDLVERHRGTRSFMVPAQFIRLLEVPSSEREAHDLSSLGLIVHAAAPCPTSVKRRIIEALPECEIHELYGASEGGATRISPDEWLSHPGSVGRAWPGIEIRVLDDSGSPVAPGEQGLIYITGMGGSRFAYHHDAESTEEAWRGDAFTVGDIGYLDEDGYLYITDRKSDMVLWGGVNIAPREIEDVLHVHPGVVDCAVFGIPDDRDGEHIKAVVEARPGVSLEDLVGHVRSHLADYKVPHAWELVDALPRDPNGKVLKRRLREEHWALHPPAGS